MSAEMLVDRLRDECEALRKENAELRADAERYRFMRSTFCAFILVLLPSLAVMWALEDLTTYWRDHEQKHRDLCAAIYRQCASALHSRSTSGHVPANLEWGGISVSVAPAEIGERIAR